LALRIRSFFSAIDDEISSCVENWDKALVVAVVNVSEDHSIAHIRFGG
jgi:hypothetical protein